MKIKIMNKGTKLVLLTDSGEVAYEVAGLTLAAGEDGVQILVQLSADEVEISGDESTDISTTMRDLLKALDDNQDEEE